MKKKFMRGATVAFAGALVAVGTAAPAGAWSDYISNNYCTAYVTSFTTHDYAYTYEVLGNCYKVGARHYYQVSGAPYATPIRWASSYAQTVTAPELTSSSHYLTNY